MQPVNNNSNASAANLPKDTVLVVEDNEMNMKLMRTVLQVKGNYEVLEADNAGDGIEMARKYRPDIILMDIMLPGMDGNAATRLLKADPELKDIPVVALTANAMSPGDKENALQAGCAGYITKPIDVRRFINTMEQFVAETQTA